MPPVGFSHFKTLTRADRAFAGYARAFFASGFGFEDFAFSLLTLARRAFTAALLFPLTAAESPRLFRGAAAFIAGTEDCPPIIAESCELFFCISTLPVLGIDQTTDHLSVMAPGIISL